MHPDHFYYHGFEQPDNLAPARKHPGYIAPKRDQLLSINRLRRARFDSLRQHIIHPSPDEKPFHLHRKWF